eukprot:TRINITY_DN7912_c0_g1_i1.p1 TRINITY_DN7912_c0_g1~~TRINITY_DN7912_c0_g1_i1.p1  ORF type:complete len:334 (-),score=83.91 TRINITY_DN7912_c0_g1_i1:9-1010(-)
MASIPVVDLAPICKEHVTQDDWDKVVTEIGNACKSIGFFYVKNHGVPKQLVSDLFSYGHKFFEKPVEEKRQINMSKAGRAFRGYFDLGGELTSKRPDWKEGLYFGAELSDDHPDVVAEKPMHGSNLWPESVPELKPVVLEYMDKLTQLGHLLMEVLARSIGLDVDYFRKNFTENPFTPFRLFYYPADKVGVHNDNVTRWGVGEHTDYGVLTILAQDHTGGLEVKTRSGEWIEAEPIEDTFVVNIGDMFQIWTGGKYTATLHRVKNKTPVNRLSAPFFFDPGFECIINPFNPESLPEGSPWRKPFRYGDYIHNKVLNNFPELAKQTGDKIKFEK